MTRTGEAVRHTAVSHQQSAGTPSPHRAHPLVGSVAAVDRVVELLSFRIRDDSRRSDVLDGGNGPDGLDGTDGLDDPHSLDDPDVNDTDASWIECEHALSDPGFFARWRVEAARWLSERHGLAVRDVVPDKTTGSYVLQLYLIIPSYLGALLFHSARRVPLLAPR